MNARRLWIAASAQALTALPTPAFAQSAVADKWRWPTFVVFGAIIGVTMYATYVAGKRVKTTSDFYLAGSGVSGLQNGWAIAGDHLSAASFLGITGLMSSTAKTASCIPWAGWSPTSPCCWSASASGLLQAVVGDAKVQAHVAAFWAMRRRT